MRDAIKTKLEKSNEIQADLRMLDIQDQEIAEIITKLQSIHPNVQRIYLSNNKIGDEGAKILAKELASFKNLSLLDVQGNIINKEGVIALEKLKSSLPKLQLALHGNVFSDVGELKIIEGKFNKI